MTHEELADAFRDLFAELHTQIDALDDDPTKIRLDAWANVAHGALERLEKHAAEGDLIQPFDGTDKPPRP